MQQPPIDLINAHTWNVDTYEAAVAFDGHIASLSDQPGDDTVVVLGAGFTGIELATEMRTRLAEHHGAEFASRARVVLVDAAATVSEDLGPGPRPQILEALQTANVELRLGTTVRRVNGNQVEFDNVDVMNAATIVITAGVRANKLAAGLGTATDGAGRLVVDRHLQIDGTPGVFAAGDIAHALTDDENHVALMSCQHAMPMGKFAGYNAASMLLDLPLEPYQQTRYVTCLDLGPWGAVFTNGWDRQVEAVKQDAKARKQFIMSELIYPPTNDRAAILEAGALG